MAYRCFNHECERWGEPQAPRVGYNLVSLFIPGVFGECEVCEQPLYFHDSLDGNERTDDELAADRRRRTAQAALSEWHLKVRGGDTSSSA